MAKPQHIHKATGYVTPDRKDAPQNQRVLTALYRVLEEHLTAGQYGTLTLTVEIKDGILLNDNTVTYCRKVRAS